MITSNFSVKLVAAAGIVAGILAASPVAQASPITVPNASFETPGTANSLGGGAIAFSGSDWLLDGPAGISGTFISHPSDGVQGAFVGTGLGYSAIYQDLGLLLPNRLYILTVDVISRSDTNFPGTTGALRLINGTTDTGTILQQTTGFSQPAQNAPFITESVQFATNASVTGDLTIALVKLSGSGTQMLYDNVRLQSVPEPASLVLLGLAAIGLAFLARRRKSN